MWLRGWPVWDKWIDANYEGEAVRDARGEERGRWRRHQGTIYKGRCGGGNKAVGMGEGGNIWM